MGHCLHAETEAPPAPPPATQSAGVVLQYHHVDTESPRITSTSPSEFKSHMAYLAEQEFEIWPLPELIAQVRAGEPTPAKVAAITFDDAYDSIYETAYPILKQYGWPFTIFVATEPGGTRQARIPLHGRSSTKWRRTARPSPTTRTPMRIYCASAKVSQKTHGSTASKRN
ncbi:MAG: polysaccharide deacetylase family protein [Gammaproteobacteria bacterium]|nr:polysaccharide deacetylase family protein [Gammaproteobacteria bacterium]